MVLYKSGLKMVTLKTLTVPLMKDTSGSGNYESCWPAIQKDAHGIVFVFNPDNSAHVKQLDSLYQVGFLPNGPLVAPTFFQVCKAYRLL